MYAFSIRSLNVGPRLGLGFGTVITLAMTLAGIALSGVSAMSAQWREFERVTLAKRVALANGQQALGDGVHHFKNYVIRGGDYDKLFEDDMARIERAAAEYHSLGALSPQEEQSLNDIADGVKAYRAEMAAATALAARGASIADQDRAGADADKVVSMAFQELVTVSQQGLKGTSQELSALLVSTYQGIAFMALLVLAVGAGFSLAIARSITSPLAKAVKVARRVAAGDLTSEVEVRSRTEIGTLMQALKDMNDNLRSIVRDVRGGTGSIATASEQIAAGNADLSSRTEQQASSLEETASSMEELTSTVKQNADNARQANQLASGASDVAVKGGRVVGQVVETMNSINDSSKKIVDIISVIDGIAFQTNILALNAAVEAARAGEQGRGFAVVAAEVRTLAQRSAAAAKEIKQLIVDSVDKVEHGTQLVDEAGKTMEQIVSSVKQVTEIMSEIAAASQEQSRGIEEVNQAIVQMDHVTQQNAALVEEASAAAESMKQQAQQLAQTVAVFKLAEGGDELAASVPMQEARPEVVKLRAVAAHTPARKSLGTSVAAEHALPRERQRRVANARRVSSGQLGYDHWTEI